MLWRRSLQNVIDTQRRGRLGRREGVKVGRIVILLEEEERVGDGEMEGEERASHRGGDEESARIDVERTMTEVSDRRRSGRLEFDDDGQGDAG